MALLLDDRAIPERFVGHAWRASVAASLALDARIATSSPWDRSVGVPRRRALARCDGMIREPSRSMSISSMTARTP